MKDKDLSKRYLSIEETQIIASNLNRIEDMREMQRTYTGVDAVFGLLGGLLVLPLGIWVAVDLLCNSKTAGEFIVELLGTILFVIVDGWYIKGNWRLLTRKV